MVTEHARELRNRAVVWAWIMAMCLFLLWLASGCSSASWQRVKAHAAEDGMAAGGGAAMVLIPFPYGLMVGLPLVAFAPVVGETMRPPDPVTVVNTDKDGKTTVKTFQPKDARDAPPPDTGWSIGSFFADLTWAVLKWSLVFSAIVLALKLIFTVRGKSLFAGARKAMRALRPVTAIKSLLAADGWLHSDTVPTVQPRKTQDTVLDSVLPQPAEGDT